MHMLTMYAFILNVTQYDSDISAYTVEKTMDMENRIKTMRELYEVKSRRPSLQVSCNGAIF